MIPELGNSQNLHQYLTRNRVRIFCNRVDCGGLLCLLGRGWTGPLLFPLHRGDIYTLAIKPVRAVKRMARNMTTVMYPRAVMAAKYKQNSDNQLLFQALSLGRHICGKVNPLFLGSWIKNDSILVGGEVGGCHNLRPHGSPPPPRGLRVTDTGLSGRWLVHTLHPAPATCLHPPAVGRHRAGSDARPGVRHSWFIRSSQSSQCSRCYPCSCCSPCSRCSRRSRASPAPSGRSASPKEGVVRRGPAPEQRPLVEGP